MRNLERLSGSDQDSVDQEMYIDLDDASVDSLTGKRGRHHVGAEVIAASDITHTVLRARSVHHLGVTIHTDRRKAKELLIEPRNSGFESLRYRLCEL